MNIYAFPLPGDPVIRPETRDEMIERMAAEALQWVRRRCSEIAAEYEPPEALESYSVLLGNQFSDAQLRASNAQRNAMLGMAASGNPYNFGGQLAQRGALSQFGLAQL